MRGIFISYRREDSEGEAGRLYADLSAHFGGDAVFMDVAKIKKGRDFRRSIDEQLSTSNVLLVLIGRAWLSVADSDGKRRLSDPSDFVRLETAAALKRDIPVVPVLLHGAQMPREQDLPEGLKELAFRNGTELTHARWDSDVKLLIEDLRPYLDLQGGAGGPESGPPSEDPKPRRLRWLWAVAALVGLVAAALGYVGWQQERERGESLRVEQQRAKADEQRRREEAEVAKAAAAKAVADKAADDQRTREAAQVADEQRKRDAAKAAEDQRRRDAAKNAEEQLQREAAKVAEEQRQRDAAKAAEEQRQRDAAKAAEERGRREAAAAEEQRRRNAAAQGLCLQGYVWREANASDHVCVTPATRAQVASDNQQAASRRQPGGGPYGPNTCRQGFVWREAYPGDVVCVTPDVRSQSAADNARASTRVVR